ncbi:MAG: ferritin family protein [Caldimicrobium sp.]
MNEKNLLEEALLKAEELEKEGKKFYLDASEKAHVPSVKELFKQLAEAEDLHLIKIREIYQNIQQERKIPQYIPRISKKKINLIFDPKELETVASVETELTALEKALNFERKSIEYYQDLSERTKDSKVRRFFLALVQEEWEHYLTIFDIMEFLRDPSSWYTFKEHWTLEGV